MIERKFVAERIKEFQIEEFINEKLKNVGHSTTKLQRTPLGEKIIIHASRPGLIVGRKGENIKKLTENLKEKFKLENPQVEIAEVENIFLEAKIVAERIASTLERFGISKFKAIGHKTITDVMNGGALGIEILISGKIPGARAKRWRFYKGYLKKCGDLAVDGVREAKTYAQLKSGTVGIQVKIMPPSIRLPDRIVAKQQTASPGAPTASTPSASAPSTSGTASSAAPSSSGASSPDSAAPAPSSASAAPSALSDAPDTSPVKPAETQQPTDKSEKKPKKRTRRKKTHEEQRPPSNA